MEFNFAFPTLKQLSIVAICQHYSDHNIGPFSEIRNPPIKWDKLFPKYNYIIDNLPIIATLKTDVGDALFGMLQQIHHSSRKLDIASTFEVDKFYFDSFGRLDDERSLRHFYQNKVTTTNNLDDLHELLQSAGERSMFSEVDKILRKMVVIASEKSEIQLDGPSHSACSTTHRMIYIFPCRLDSRSSDSSKIAQLNRFQSSTLSITLYENGIAFHVIPYYWNSNSFKKHYNLLEPLDRDCFAEEVVRGLYFCITGRHLLEILTFLHQKKHNWISYFAKVLQKGRFRWFCKRLSQLLNWPFTQFFVPVCRLMAPILEDHAHLYFRFWEQLRNKADQQYGMLYNDLLEEFRAMVANNVRVLL